MQGDFVGKALMHERVRRHPFETRLQSTAQCGTAAGVSDADESVGKYTYIEELNQPGADASC